MILTVIIRDSSEGHVHYGAPAYRTVDIHLTGQQVALMEYLINTYTLEGEIVLDFTMGSGTTGVACQNTQRAFIGIEQDEKYFNIAAKRIADAKEPQ